MSVAHYYDFLPRNKFQRALPLLWAASSILAELRTSSNRRRLSHRDRGGDLNQRGDLVGAFGELYVFFSALKHEKQEVIAHMRGTIYSPHGGAGLSSTSDAPKLDVKSFDFGESKKFLAINSQKHRSLSGEIEDYYFVFAPPLSREIFLPSLVPWGAVQKWTEFSLGDYSDPSRNLDLGSFREVYAPDLDIARLRNPLFYEMSEIEVLLKKAKELLCFNFPTISTHFQRVT